MTSHLDHMSVGGFEFNIGSSEDNIHYMSSRPSSPMGNVLDELPREHTGYRLQASFYSKPDFSPSLSNIKYESQGQNNLSYATYQSLFVQDGASPKEEVRNRQELEADNCHLNKYFDGVRPHDSYAVHCQVVETITRELEYESKFQNKKLDLDDKPTRKRRRKPHEVNWKPESIFRSYVDCKPADINKTSYPDNVPMCSCFGRINMREAKAWSRQPNKPKKQRIKMNPPETLHQRRGSQNRVRPASSHDQNSFYLMDSAIP